MNPKSRKEDLAIQDLNGELFVYDLVTDQMYSLNTTSAFVWNHLDGKASVEMLARKTSEQFNQPVSEDFIWLAIEELRKFNLLDEENAPKAMSKMKRREMVKRVGLASLVALPMISSLVAPTAANAASGGTCTGPTNVGTDQPCSRSCQCANTPTFCCMSYYTYGTVCHPASHAGLPDHGQCIT